MSKEKVEFEGTKESLEKLVYAIKEVSNLQAQAESVREAIADIKKSVKENLGIDGKKFGLLLNMYHKDKREQVEDEIMEVIDLYDTLFNKSSGDEE